MSEFFRVRPPSLAVFDAARVERSALIAALLLFVAMLGIAENPLMAGGGLYVVEEAYVPR